MSRVTRVVEAVACSVIDNDMSILLQSVTYLDSAFPISAHM